MKLARPTTSSPRAHAPTRRAPEEAAEVTCLAEAVSLLEHLRSEEENGKAEVVSRSIREAEDALSSGTHFLWASAFRDAAARQTPAEPEELPSQRRMSEALRRQVEAAYARGTGAARASTSFLDSSSGAAVPKRLAIRSARRWALFGVYDEIARKQGLPTCGFRRLLIRRPAGSGQTSRSDLLAMTRDELGGDAMINTQPQARLSEQETVEEQILERSGLPWPRTPLELGEAYCSAWRGDLEEAPLPREIAEEITSRSQESGRPMYSVFSEMVSKDSHVLPRPRTVVADWTYEEEIRRAQAFASEENLVPTSASQFGRERPGPEDGVRFAALNMVSLRFAEAIIGGDDGFSDAYERAQALTGERGHMRPDRSGKGGGRGHYLGGVATPMHYVSIHRPGGDPAREADIRLARAICLSPREVSLAAEILGELPGYDPRQEELNEWIDATPSLDSSLKGDPVERDGASVVVDSRSVGRQLTEDLFLQKAKVTGYAYGPQPISPFPSDYAEGYLSARGWKAFEALEASLLGVRQTRALALPQDVEAGRGWYSKGVHRGLSRSEATRALLSVYHPRRLAIPSERERHLAEIEGDLDRQYRPLNSSRKGMLIPGPRLDALTSRGYSEKKIHRVAKLLSEELVGTGSEADAYGGPVALFSVGDQIKCGRHQAPERCECLLGGTSVRRSAPRSGDAQVRYGRSQASQAYASARPISV